MEYHIVTSQESDGRWAAKVPAMPGLVVYDDSQNEALQAARKICGILLDDENASGGRILAFHLGRVPSSARILSNSLDMPFARATA
jgi:predicted RNase H-like HicB family nuclease